jgi:hypothetical protein
LTSDVDRRSLRSLTTTWDTAVEFARAADFPYEVALALDGRIALHGDGVDPALVDERDDLFRRLGVVLPPRPPWVATVTDSSAT